MKKKLIAILLITTMTISLSACGSTETSNNDNDRVKKLEDQIAELKTQNAELQRQLGESMQETTSNNNTSSASASINESTAETWGVCGADLTWYYQNNILVIRGAGEMADYSYSYGTRKANHPWVDLDDKIHWLYIEDGVTSIGEDAFRGCHYLSKIEIANSVTVISDGAFEDCEDLTSVTIPNSVIYIGDAFDNLEEMMIDNPNRDLCIDSMIFNDDTKIIINGTEYTWEDGIDTDIIKFIYYDVEGVRIE